MRFLSPTGRVVKRFAGAVLVFAVVHALIGGALARRVSILAQAPTPSPPPTETPFPLPAPVPGSIVGRLPKCDVSGRLGLSTSEVAVGEALTMTIDVAMACPHQFDRAAALVVVAGIDDMTVDGVRSALGVIVEALALEADGRMAVLRAGDDPDAVHWAASVEERATVGQALRTFEPGELPSATEWSTLMADAAAALSDAPRGYRPLLIVVHAAEPPGTAAAARAALDRAAVIVRDRVGFTIALDASLNSWLLERALGPPIDGMIGVVDGTPAAHAMWRGVEQLVQQVNAPIDGSHTTLSISEALRFDTRSAVPPVVGAEDGGFLTWKHQPTERYRTRATVSIRVRGFAADASSIVIAGAFGLRQDVERAEGESQVTSICVYPPDIGSAFCHLPPTAQPSETPTPVGFRPSPTPTRFRAPPRVPPSPTPPADTRMGVVHLPVVRR